VFAIRPWEWERLTVEETDSLIRYIERRNADMKKGADGG
jgi:hypothetical protein